MRKELSAQKVRKSCPLKSLTCDSTRELKPLQSIIGQSRALQAIQFGLGINEKGFNIYAAGQQGTGRTTAIKTFLDSLASKKEPPPDWCYIYNFKDTYCPKALSLPAGKGHEFKRDMRQLIDRAQNQLSKVSESGEYATRKDAVLQEFQKKRDDALHKLNDKANAQGLGLQAVSTGLTFIPVTDGKPMNEEAFAALSQGGKGELAKQRDILQAELKELINKLNTEEREISENIEKMEREAAHAAIGTLIEKIEEKYSDLPDLLAYLKEVQEDIVDNLNDFRSDKDNQAQSALPFMTAMMKGQSLRKYGVNLIVDNSKLTGVPVILELNPTFGYLFGRIEKEAQFGMLQTDFTMIRGGSLHKANGGYIVLKMEDIIANPLSWDGLKRTLRDEQIAIEEIGERLGFVTTKSLRPEPIPLNLKVIIIGSPMIYQLLYRHDPDFNELFKVKADFDSSMNRSRKNVQDYASFICTLCEKEKMNHLDKTAIAKTIEQSSRLAEDQEKLSTRFADIADTIREANFWAHQDKSSLITGSHITRAVEEKVYRSNLIQEHIAEMIQRGTLIIDTEGEEIGQVNGLAVLDLGNFSFGKPSRITATVALGRGGLIDIEREAKLGGPLHTKGVMILSGYLADKFASDTPLSLSARLVFEQSYSGVDGDSASSTELYALLSRLAELPIKQGIAVTGSVSQKGKVQAIGGVNQKIEGFFEVCKARKLNGTQGVMIPQSNVKNLMLKEEVVEAVKEGKFHIYSVATIDEGIEILTGVKAGRKLSKGGFTKDSVNDRVQKRLKELAQGLKEFGTKDDKASNEKKK